MNKNTKVNIKIIWSIIGAIDQIHKDIEVEFSLKEYFLNL